MPSKVIQRATVASFLLSLHLSCTRRPIFPVDPPPDVADAAVDAGAEPRVYDFPAPLVRVWGADDDLWAVGGLERGAVFHFDGTAWRDLSPPDAPPLKDGVGSFDAEVFVVGASLTALRRADGVWQLEHQAAETATFVAVDGAAGASLWAVGVRAAPGVPCVAFERAAGRWREAAPADFDGSFCSDIAVAADGTVTVASTVSGLHDFDGASWRRREDVRARQVHRIGDDLLVVGKRELYLQGAGWSTLWDVGWRRRLLAVGGRSPARLFAVTLEREPTQCALFRFDGDTWSLERPIDAVAPWVWVGETRVYVLTERGTRMLSLPVGER